MQERKREEKGIWWSFLIWVLEEDYVLIEVEKLASLLCFLQQF
ncbi:MAG: hypothetical protein PHT13_07305 [Methanosarcina sp.]|nr:hypothetical protein [Methanosarcina sp.]